MIMLVYSMRKSTPLGLRSIEFAPILESTSASRETKTADNTSTNKSAAQILAMGKIRKYEGRTGIVKQDHEASDGPKVHLE